MSTQHQKARNNMTIDLNQPYCVYVTKHTSSDLYYIGKSQPDKIIFSGYQGSGNKLNLRLSEPGFEPDHWATKIIATFDNESDAYECESKLVTLKRLCDPNCLNEKLGGEGANCFLSNVVKKSGHIINASDSDIIIRDVTIRIDAQGRYNLNDIWVAAGKPNNKNPGQWTRHDGTKNYVKYLVEQNAKSHSGSDQNVKSHSAVCANPLYTVIGGIPATYAVENLAIDYAAWISISFKDEVYNVYREAMRHKLEEAEKKVIELQADEPVHRPELQQALQMFGDAIAVGELIGLSPIESCKLIKRYVKKTTGVHAPF